MSDERICHIKRWKGGWGWMYVSGNNAPGWDFENVSAGCCIMAVAEGEPMEHEESPKDALYDEGLYTDFRYDSILALDQSKGTNRNKAAIVQLAKKLGIPLKIHPYHEPLSERYLTLRPNQKDRRG